MRLLICGLLLLTLAAPTPVSSSTQETPQASAGRFVPPTDGVVSRRFDPGAHRYAAGHRGVDLRGTTNGEVRAAGDGRVAFAGDVAGRPTISIAHSGGLRTTYEPVAAIVHAGEFVRAGDAIGHLLPGHPGCPTSACLHWGLRHDGRGAGDSVAYLDPLLLLGRGAVRLKPLQPGDET